jgi:hypothetical protein
MDEVKRENLDYILKKLGADTVIRGQAINRLANKSELVVSSSAKGPIEVEKVIEQTLGIHGKILRNT